MYGTNAKKNNFCFVSWIPSQACRKLFRTKFSCRSCPISLWI